MNGRQRAGLLTMQTFSFLLLLRCLVAGAPIVNDGPLLFFIFTLLLLLAFTIDFLSFFFHPILVFFLFPFFVISS